MPTRSRRPPCRTGHECVLGMSGRRLRSWHQRPPVGWHENQYARHRDFHRFQPRGGRYLDDRLMNSTVEAQRGRVRFDRHLANAVESQLVEQIPALVPIEITGVILRGSLRVSKPQQSIAGGLGAASALIHRSSAARRVTNASAKAKRPMSWILRCTDRLPHRSDDARNTFSVRCKQRRYCCKPVGMHSLSGACSKYFLSKQRWCCPFPGALDSTTECPALEWALRPPIWPALNSDSRRPFASLRRARSSSNEYLPTFRGPSIC